MQSITKALIVVLLSFSSVAQSDTVYKCVGDDGKTEFSDKPCAINPEEIEIPIINGMSAPESASYSGGNSPAGSRSNSITTDSNDRYGPKGGNYYITKNGTKRYRSQDK